MWALKIEQNSRIKGCKTHIQFSSFRLTEVHICAAMAALMIDDILDIGTSRWRGNVREMEGITSAGAPTQFMLPQCDNVSIV